MDILDEEVRNSVALVAFGMQAAEEENVAPSEKSYKKAKRLVGYNEDDGSCQAKEDMASVKSDSKSPTQPGK